MKSEKTVFTDFNFSFITFPRQVFVNIIDSKAAQNKGRNSIKKLGFWKENCQTPIILFIIKADNILRNGHFLYLCPINHL